MATTNMQSMTIGQHAISYDRQGDPTNPTVVLLTGWCQDHRLFDPLVPLLSDDFDVVRIDWRGHGADRSPVADFGPEEQATDTVAVLDALQVDRFLPVSTSHGGWANIEILARVVADRVPAAIVIDWIMTEAGPEFLDSLIDSQDPEHWREAQSRLFDVWMGTGDNALVRTHLDEEMADFDYEMWARSCRVIHRAYDTWGSPLRRMAALVDDGRASRPAIRHLFSQPTAPEYERAQAAFATDHPWFSYRNLGGETHFPTLDSPALVAEEIAKVARAAQAS